MQTALRIMHGNIETPEEQETLQAISDELLRSGRLTSTHATNDTTVHHLDGPCPDDVLAMVLCGVDLYPHWKVARTRIGTLGEFGG